MKDESMRSTSSSKQMTFDRLGADTKSPYGIFCDGYPLANITIDDMLKDSGKPTGGCNSLPYKTPKTYLRRNKYEETKAMPDRKNLSADGEAFTMGKAKREHFFKPPTFGKDGKEPPHSYLNLRQWAAKKEAKVDGKKMVRKTYIDDVLEYNKKHKYPGPDSYFKESKKAKESTVVKVDGKKLVRPSFLDEYQYVGLNNPAPGAYNPQVTSG